RSIVLGPDGESAVPFEAGELHRSRADEASGNVLLHIKDVINLGIIRFGPNVSPGGGMGQLDVDAKAITSAEGRTAPDQARATQRRWRPKRSSRADRRSSHREEQNTKGKATMTSITVPHSLILERILSLEIVRVTERAAVNAARLRGRGEEKAAD